MEGSSKTIWYVAGALVVIAGGVGVWMMMGSNTVPGASEETSTPQSQNTTLKGLLGMSNAQKCTFTSSTDTSNSSGTVYVANGQMRGDFTSTSGGNTIQSHMIVKDNASYVWSDAFAGGFKTSLDAMSSKDTTSQGGVDPNEPVDYSCTSWGVDSSMFVLPTNIQFQDITAGVGASVEAGASAGSTINSAQCAACEQIPDASGKAQCKVALKCK